jgi:hypothetical protein
MTATDCDRMIKDLVISDMVFCFNITTIHFTLDAINEQKFFLKLKDATYFFGPKCLNLKPASHKWIFKGLYTDDKMTPGDNAAVEQLSNWL